MQSFIKREESAWKSLPKMQAADRGYFSTDYRTKDKSGQCVPVSEKHQYGFSSAYLRSQQRFRWNRLRRCWRKVGGRTVLVRDEEHIFKDGITEESAAAFGEYVSRQIAAGSNMRAGAEYREASGKGADKTGSFTDGGQAE